MAMGSLAIRTQTIETVPLAPVRKRALVVDDSETILHAICSLLEVRPRAHPALSIAAGKRRGLVEDIPIDSIGRELLMG